MDLPATRLGLLSVLVGFLVGVVWLDASVAHAAGGAIRITEVVADNRSLLADEHGEFDDYVELQNVSDESARLGGAWLSDDPGRPRRWRLPDGLVLAPGEVVLVWADGQPEQGPLHASFRLSKDGEVVLLTDARDASRMLDRVEFGPLGPDRAVGRVEPGSGSDAVGPVEASPGSPNVVDSPRDTLAGRVPRS